MNFDSISVIDVCTFRSL